MADLDIEETNRLRAALGMAPLSTSKNDSDLQFKKSSDAKGGESDSDDLGSTLDSRQAAAGDNWKKLQAEADEKKRREERRLKLRKERDAAQKYAKLEGKGLGDADDEVDTRSWLLASQKRQKKIEKQRAKALQKELEERENQAQYTEKDLKGAKVAHELGDFDEEGEHILTLKDAEIGDESEDDELENADLRDKEKASERMKLKKQQAQYDPNAEDGEAGGVLNKYDEEINGKKRKHFTLDGFGRTAEEGTAAGAERKGPQGMQFNLDLPMEDKPTSDYVDPSEIKVKKPKKRKEKTKRKRDADQDDDIFAGAANGTAPAIGATDAMEIEGSGNNSAAPNGTSKPTFDTSLADDEDLQAQLANSRREALKKRKRARPEDIARQMREEAAEDGNAMETNDQGAGLVIDETSGFVSNLQKPKAPEERRSPSRAKSIKRETPAGSPVDEEDVPMKDEDASDDEDNMKDNRHFKPEPSPGAPGPHTATGLADEETFQTIGIGSTLGVMRGRGMLKGDDGTKLEADSSHQAKFKALKERLTKEATDRSAERRKRDRENGKFDRMTKREQEEYAQALNREADHYVSRRLAELFNEEYKPSVELKYTDEFGRSMDSREAFKQMSHQFHGKGSGKLKTEKRLKKIEEEKAREAKSALDSSQQAGMDRAGAEHARKNRQAGVRLQ